MTTIRSSNHFALYTSIFAVAVSYLSSINVAILIIRINSSSRIILTLVVYKILSIFLINYSIKQIAKSITKKIIKFIININNLGHFEILRL